MTDHLWPAPKAKAPLRADSVRAPGRRDKGLTRDEIVHAAVTLADAEGAAAVNMRHIAKEIGVGAMSLYWHVADKDQLLDLMVDAVDGEGVSAQLSGEWRGDLAMIARQRRLALLRHPWAVSFMSGRPPYGPNSLQQIEQSLSALDGLEVDDRTRLQILMTIDTYVTGSVLHELREIQAEQTRSEAELADADAEDEMRGWRGRLDRSGQFERVVRVFAEGIDPDAADTRDERFEFGLECVLIGVSARIA